MLQQRGRKPLSPAQRHRIRKTGLNDGQRIQHSLHQDDAGSSLQRLRVENPRPGPSTATMLHFCACRKTAAIEAGDAVVAVAQREHDATREKLFPPLVEKPHALQQLLFLGVADGQQPIAVTVSHLQVPQ